ncbi:MAG: YceI family protein [Pseudomonadota bacterium]
MRIVTIAAALFALAAAPLAAAPWKIDRSHAHITFSVSHLGFSETQGVFRKFDAEIDFDPESVETASVTFVIDAESVDTNWPARDRHVRSKDFLDVKNHPEIRFVSTAVRLRDEETADVTGDLTIRGVTKEETFTAKMRKIAPSPFNPEQIVAGFMIEGEIDRREYGVDYGAPAIGVMVPLRIDVEISPAE